MFKLVLILGLAFCMANAKPNPLVCDIDTIPQDPDFAANPLPSHPEGVDYRVLIEENKDGFTTETQEYYSGKLNIARSRSLLTGLTLNQYVYPETKELLMVEGTVCTRTDLTNNEKAVAADTTFMVVKGADEKLKVVGGTFGILDVYKKYVKPDLVVKYIGKGSQLRGIPVRQWVACLYDEEKDTTSKVTVSYSESTYSDAQMTNGSVPIGVEIVSKKGEEKIVTAIKSILSFRIKDQIEEEDLYTESGVYCAGRVNTKELPIEQNAFSAWIQHSIPKANSFEMIGDVNVKKIEFDFSKQLTREEYYVNDHEIREIHDLKNGLNYKLDKNTNECAVTKLSPNATNSLAKIFRFDEDPPFQYIGKRRVRGINTDVWIAVRDWNGMKATWEWHFSTDEWTFQESTALGQNEPVLLTVTCGCNSAGPKSPEYFHITNYDKTNADAFDFDISRCNNDIDSKNIRFQIKPSVDVYEKMKRDQLVVRLLLTQAILQTTSVRLPRIGELETEFHNKTIFVTFTLFDKPNFYGDGVDGSAEIDLTAAEKKLSTAVAAEQFTIQYFDATTKAEKNSYVILAKRDGRYVFEIRETGETVHYTLGSVFAFLVVFALVGIICGFVGGYFLIIKRTAPLPALPGPLSFLNPAYAEQSNA